jgi:hypothetical protein
LTDPHKSLSTKYDEYQKYYNTEAGGTAINWGLSYAFTALGILSSLHVIVMYCIFGQIYMPSENNW